MKQRPRVGPDKVGPDDPRYADLVRRGFNKRFAGKPDFVRLVGSTEQVVDAVQDAVRDNVRVVVRSGGHCLEGFATTPYPSDPPDGGAALGPGPAFRAPGSAAKKRARRVDLAGPRSS